jgi:hypothetical protein
MHKADVNLQGNSLLSYFMLTYILGGGKYGTALQAAAVRGQLGIIKLLFAHKVNVNLQGK